MIANERIPFQDYIFQIINDVKRNSTCMRRHIGAVIVKDKKIIATGYNGAPSGVIHCYDHPDGCLREKLNVPSGKNHELCRGAHAEQNAINYCARYGISTNDATIYCTNRPCSMCMKSIINAGITSVIYLEPYDDDLTDFFIAQKGSDLIVKRYTPLHK